MLAGGATGRGGATGAGGVVGFGSVAGTAGVTGDATAVEGSVTVGRAGKTGDVDAAGTVGVVSLVTCAGVAGAVRPAVGFETVIAGDSVVDLNLSKAPVTAFEAATAASRKRFPVVNAGMGGSWVAAVPKIAATPAPVAA